MLKLKIGSDEIDSLPTKKKLQVLSDWSGLLVARLRPVSWSAAGANSAESLEQYEMQVLSEVQVLDGHLHYS